MTGMTALSATVADAVPEVRVTVPVVDTVPLKVTVTVAFSAVAASVAGVTVKSLLLDVRVMASSRLFPVTVKVRLSPLSVNDRLLVLAVMEAVSVDPPPSPEMRMLSRRHVPEVPIAPLPVKRKMTLLALFKPCTSEKSKK